MGPARFAVLGSAALVVFAPACGGEGGGGGGGPVSGGGSLDKAQTYLIDYDFGERTKKGLAEIIGLVGSGDEAKARTLRARVVTDVLLFAADRKDDKLVAVLGATDRAAAIKMGIEDAAGGGDAGAAWGKLLRAIDTRGKSPDALKDLRAIATGPDKEVAVRARIVGITACLDGFDAALAAPADGVEPALADCGVYVAGTPRPWAGALETMIEDFRWLAENAKRSPVLPVWSKLDERLGELRKKNGSRLPRVASLDGIDLPESAVNEVVDFRAPYARITKDKVWVDLIEIAPAGSEGLYAKVVDSIVAMATTPESGPPPALTVYADKASTYFVLADLLLAAQTAGLDGAVVVGVGPEGSAGTLHATHLRLPAPKGVEGPKKIDAVLSEKGLTVAGKGGGTVPVVDGKLDVVKARELIAKAAETAKAEALQLEIKAKVPVGHLVAVAESAMTAVGAGGKPLLGALIVDPMAGRAIGPPVTGPLTPSDADARGSIDGKEVKRIVGGRLGAIKSCYEKELKRDHGLRGRVAARVVVNTDGSVRYVSIELDTMKNAKIRSCVTTTLQKLLFPKPVGGRATFIYPFDLEPTGS